MDAIEDRYCLVLGESEITMICKALAFYETVVFGSRLRDALAGIRNKMLGLLEGDGRCPAEDADLVVKDFCCLLRHFADDDLTVLTATARGLGQFRMDDARQMFDVVKVCVELVNWVNGRHSPHVTFVKDRDDGR